MAHYDVFNGDADGICALQQLRLADPRPGVLVTGIKRDIALLERVPAQAGDSATVLDVSLERNRTALLELLARGVRIEYFDHHFAGELPAHPLLQLHIDTAPGMCTSVLVDRQLAGAHRLWALVGAWGDNLPATAQALALAAGLQPAALDSLRVLGEAINYNAYGDCEADLLLPPAQLYQRIRPYASPLAFIAQDPLAGALALRQRDDLAHAAEIAPHAVLAGGSVYLLPDAAWSRRVQGAFANALSLRAPQAAHAVLRPAGPGLLLASVRAPLRSPQGADSLCRAFPSGGGRAAAAGIDRLPAAQLQEFIGAFERAYPAAA
ncbi:acetyltransferase [Caenimonas terrae]|uniref:Acetyltransferase n=1 Tax=Caenimonas terrae TaxID=696074 RepID=A0ABW0NI30_9BURK